MNIEQSVEAILFVADQPLSVEQIAHVLGVDPTLVRAAVSGLASRLDRESALQVIRVAGGYQLATRATFAETIATLHRPQRRRLSKVMMEVLAIVAYRQPVTLAEIDALRGVQSDSTIRTLIDRRLLKEVGRKRTPGRPMLYGTTDQFLHSFDLDSLDQLAPLEIPALEAEIEAHEGQPALLS